MSCDLSDAYCDHRVVQSHLTIVVDLLGGKSFQWERGCWRTAQRTVSSDDVLSPAEDLKQVVEIKWMCNTSGRLPPLLPEAVHSSRLSTSYPRPTCSYALLLLVNLHLLPPSSPGSSYHTEHIRSIEKHESLQQMLTSPSQSTPSSNLPPSSTSSPSPRSRSHSTAPLSIESMDLSFIIGIRTLQQLKCSCRRQFARDPRRATFVFATLKDAFEENKELPMGQIPEIYRPFFTDLRRGY